jgi:hypothetical protein
VVYGYALGLNQRTGARWEHRTFRGSGDVLVPILDAFGVRAIDMLSPLTRREVFVRYPFYEDIFAEGEAAYLKAAMRYDFAFIDRPVVVLRDHGSNRGRALKKNYEMTAVALRRLGEHPDFPPSAQPALREAKARLAWQLARLGGEGDEVRWCAREALKTSWKSALDPRLAGAITLSMLPRGLRASVNRIGHRVRGGVSNVGVVDGYGGSS